MNTFIPLVRKCIEERILGKFPLSLLLWLKKIIMDEKYHYYIGRNVLFDYKEFCQRIFLSNNVSDIHPEI